MEKYLEDVIKRIYIEKDYDFFINQCHKELDFIDELKNITDKLATNIIEPDSIYDSYIEARYKYDLFEKGEFKVSYDSTLNISKIIPIFFIRHRFEVYTSSKDACREICNSSEQPYNKHQDDLHKIVSSFLLSKGYKELSFNEIGEVLSYLKMPDGITLTMCGPQMTLEAALFYDMYDINPEEEDQYNIR